jgi:hypothetical protein
MYDKVKRMLAHELGPYYQDTRLARLVRLDLLPIRSNNGNATRCCAVMVLYRLNDHPLGKVWRLRAAEADVFEVMKALYTSKLPIDSVRMRGQFPLTVKKRMKVVTAVIAYMDHRTAVKIQWDSWQRNRDTEARLWKLLTRVFVAPGFA